MPQEGAETLHDVSAASVGRAVAKRGQRLAPQLHAALPAPRGAHAPQCGGLAANRGDEDQSAQPSSEDPAVAAGDGQRELLHQIADEWAADDAEAADEMDWEDEALDADEVRACMLCSI